MKWDSSLICGVELIDNEHMELFRIVNELPEIGKAEKSIEKTEEVLTFLGDYVVQHFAHEEALMAACSYPKMDEHKELHVKFVQTFLDLKRKFEESEDPISVSTQINYTAMSWLLNHIKVIDMRFIEYYKEHSD